MKRLITFALLSVSLQALAIDAEKYCLPFLNGSLDEQSEKPKIMEGLKASKAKIQIAGNMVDSIDIVPEDVDTKGEVKTESFPWGEEQIINIVKFKKNGKPTKDYKLIVRRDKSGNLISISKKPNFFQDLKLSADTLYFKPQKDTCIPEKYIARNKLEFSTDLCRELDRFWVENPQAKACLVARYDKKLASLVKEYSKALGEKVILGIEKRSEDMTPLYAAKHRVDCSENGLDGILGDSELWDNFNGKRGEEKIKDKGQEQ